MPEFAGIETWEALMAQPTSTEAGEPAPVGDVVMRVAALADVEVLVGVVNRAYRGVGDAAGWTTEGHLLGGQRVDAEMVGAAVETAGKRVVVAEADGGVVGCCVVERRTGERGGFGMFAVEPGLQGRGVGGALLAEAEQVAKEWGCREMAMEVISVRADLIAWYGRRGYRPTGERVPFPYDNERFGVPRREDLEFAVLVKELTSSG